MKLRLLVASVKEIFEKAQRETFTRIRTLEGKQIADRSKTQPDNKEDHQAQSTQSIRSIQSTQEFENIALQAIRTIVHPPPLRVPSSSGRNNRSTYESVTTATTTSSGSSI